MPTALSRASASAAVPIRKSETAPSRAPWRASSPQGKISRSDGGGLERSRQVEPRLVVEGVGQGDSQRGGGRVVVRLGAANQPGAGALVERLRSCVRTTSGRPWTITVSIGRVIRLCRPSIQRVE